MFQKDRASGDEFKKILTDLKTINDSLLSMSPGMNNMITNRNITPFQSVVKYVHDQLPKDASDELVSKRIWAALASERHKIAYLRGEKPIQLEKQSKSEDLKPIFASAFKELIQRNPTEPEGLSENGRDLRKQLLYNFNNKYNDSDRIAYLRHEKKVMNTLVNYLDIVVQSSKDMQKKAEEIRDRILKFAHKGDFGLLDGTSDHSQITIPEASLTAKAKELKTKIESVIEEKIPYVVFGEFNIPSEEERASIERAQHYESLLREYYDAHKAGSVTTQLNHDIMKALKNIRNATNAQDLLKSVSRMEFGEGDKSITFIKIAQNNAREDIVDELESAEKLPLVKGEPNLSPRLHGQVSKIIQDMEGLSRKGSIGVSDQRRQGKRSHPVKPRPRSHI